ncbi:gamma-glutamyltransferase 2. Threonine peptidase. MEROPS family T03 [Sulfitobacter brevis]|uniref:Gamma-glutamyltransferase 2. Threonine peptidase. MEROPS family T03 n=1 Tax=Sulfitobacter brevis TaxID=74348 RepID=A0A1I2F949_9RHOB|nr:gamma-glutamyltransferase [Sulfitobacter brevis]SFF01872.1 gamma-glutamyltransferase 2. Threonine peptidase. MEROPS family T03 [Sulfitobacter brevis]
MTETWAVATGHPTATRAAERILRMGGNAVDAGVAAGLTLGVVQPDLVSIAGVAPIVMYDAASGRVTSQDGVGGWPAAANVEEMHREHGNHVPEGLLRTVIPAAPASWIRALSEKGTLRFADIALEALEAAKDGFEVYPLFANFVASRQNKYARFASTAEIFLPAGRPPAVGERFIQRDLAWTLEQMIAAEATCPTDRGAGLAAARAAFYEGPIAEKIVQFHALNGGLLTAADLAGYQVREEATIPIHFRGTEVHCCGAWCQGISMAEALAMVEAAGPEAATRDGALNLHFLIEVLKRVFADREAYVTDPDHMDVSPLMLVASEFIAERLSTIHDSSDPLPAPGLLNPSSGEPSVFHIGCADTSHVSVIDGAGNIFSATPSDPSYDTQVIPGTGLSVSSRGSQSRSIPGHLNALAPGKRPRLTPNPILALKDGKPWLAMGTPGGDVQIQAMIQVLLNILDLGMSPAEAVRAPRVATFAFPGSFAPHDVHPNKILCEADLPDAQVADLVSRGHDVEAWPEETWMAGGICLALRDPKGGVMAVADSRRAGTAATGPNPSLEGFQPDEE